MRSAWIRVAAIALTCGAIALGFDDQLLACTGFCAVGADGRVLVGNNEDYDIPRTKLWFVPATPGAYGRMYVGFDDLSPQGGMNEKGLFFDGFAAPPVRAAGSADLPQYSGNITDAAMAQCATVDEVVRLFSGYNRSFLSDAILMFADANGDAVSIEADAIVRKTGRYFVQTNFHQSRPQHGRDGRFLTATSMLDRAGDRISDDLARDILAATHQEGPSTTLYSNVYDLRARTMRLYLFHDYSRAVTFSLDEELKKGAHTLDIPSLFPRNAAAEAYAAAHPPERAPLSGGVVGAAALAFVCLAIGASAYGWRRGGRVIQFGLAAIAAVIVIPTALTIVAFNMVPDRSAPWMRFSIGPATGDSARESPGLVWADGMTIRRALAIAYQVPAERVIGPAWLSETRYSINAVAGLDAEDALSSMLQQELKNRLHVEAHVESRPFDAFVLSAPGPVRLVAAKGQSPATWIRKKSVLLRDGSMGRLALALQAILGRPVIDETHVKGDYDLAFEWSDDRVASVSATLRDRFGLQLTPATRNLDALIVDGIRRDPAMYLLAHAGRLTRSAPPFVRQRLASLLTIH